MQFNLISEDNDNSKVLPRVRGLFGIFRSKSIDRMQLWWSIQSSHTITHRFYCHQWHIATENNRLSEHLLTWHLVQFEFLLLLGFGYLSVCGALVMCLFVVIYYFIFYDVYESAYLSGNDVVVILFCFGHSLVYWAPIYTKITCWNFPAASTSMSPLIASFFDGFKVRQCADAPALAAPFQNGLLIYLNFAIFFSLFIVTSRSRIIIFRCFTLTHYDKVLSLDSWLNCSPPWIAKLPVYINTIAESLPSNSQSIALAINTSIS